MATFLNNLEHGKLHV